MNGALTDRELRCWSSARCASVRRICPFLVALFLVSSGCGQGARIQGRLDLVRQILREAELEGAYRCAPRELAVARAHASFARVELRQGNAGDAQAHLRVAEPNARAARTLSATRACRDALGSARSSARSSARRGADASRVSPRDPNRGQARCPGAVARGAGIPELLDCPERADTDSDGVVDRVDSCLLQREDLDGYLDGDGCPDPDNDLDGVADAADKCPLELEDLDGVDDLDGCPDPDNDADGLPDDIDRCPLVPGPASTFGCAQAFKRLQLTKRFVLVKEPIRFVRAGSEIAPASFSILDELAHLLHDFPRLRLKIVVGAPSRGSRARGLQSSRARAEALRRYLVDRGVAPSRLTARAYGATRTGEQRALVSGPSATRRISFVRTDARAVVAGEGAR
ncbi:MAG: OmpA family protein [Proteobacteria bacterium]|nr:OmpA family protein [Pseudomonadota bacterium]